VDKAVGGCVPLKSLVNAYVQDNISRSFSAACNILLSISKFGAAWFQGMRLSPHDTGLQRGDGCRAELIPAAGAVSPMSLPPQMDGQTQVCAHHSPLCKCQKNL